MGILKEKFINYTAPQELMAAGVYPYFREIQSDQDTVVIINGKRVLMFGSNSYLGLTSHPKIKEAAIRAIKNTVPAVPVLVFERDSRYSYSTGRQIGKIDRQGGCSLLQYRFSGKFGSGFRVGRAQ